MFFEVALENFFYLQENNVFISVSVVPNSSKTQFMGLYNNTLKIKLKAKPVDNAANDLLVRFLADKLNVPRSNIQIIRGQNSKKKLISIVGCPVKQIEDLA